MKSWARTFTLRDAGRSEFVRVGLAVVLIGGLVWALPVRRAGQDGGHHGSHAPELDAFERAGVTELKEGHATPPLRLPRLDGGVTALADHRDKLVIVNFWATWCQPCLIEMPTLEALWQQYRSRGLVVLGVSVDRDAPRPLLDPYVGRLGLTFPVLLDADLKSAQTWRVTGLPATFIVRPGGHAIGMAFGAREWNSAEMRRLLEPLLPHHLDHGKPRTTSFSEAVPFAGTEVATHSSSGLNRVRRAAWPASKNPSRSTFPYASRTTSGRSSRSFRASWKA